MNIAQRSFAHGEVAPAQYAGTDRAFYRQALRTLLNAYVMRGGGLQSRPGTTYKGTTKASGAAQLVECVFDDDQNYVLEFGANYVRFWKDGAQVVGVSTGSWANATIYAAGIVLLHSGTYYVCLQSHTSATANDRPNDGTNRLDYWHALTGLIYELPTDYGSAILKELQFVATLGVLRIAHNTVPFQTLTRVANAQWYFSTITNSISALAAPTGLAWTGASSSSGVKFVVTAYSSVTGLESQPSAIFEAAESLATLAGATETLTWSAVTGATVYRIYRLDENTSGAYGLVMGTTGLGYGEDGSLTADVLQPPPTSAGGSFSDSTTYPGVIGAYQQRVFVSGSTGTPDTVRGSKSGSPDDFTASEPLRDSDAVSFRMMNARVVRPRHFLEVARSLLMFANIGEVAVEGDDTGIITPAGINPRFISQNGAAKYPSPLPVNGTALYVQARGGVVRDVQAGAAGDDLTVLSGHLVDGYTIVDWCYQQTPHSIVWAVRSDGVLLSLTYQREAGVLGWARHTTDGTVESVACVPESTEDAVYLVVNRTINSSTVRYVERLANRGAATAALVLSDAASTVSGAHPHSSLSITGGAGSVYGDGYTHSGETATGSGGSGSFTSADVGRTFSFVYNSIRGYGLITGYTSATIVTVDYWWPSASDLSNPQVFTTGNWWWTSAVGLSHLAVEAVSVWRDGAVLASPYNANATASVTMTSGGIANFGGLQSGFGNVASLPATGSTATASYTTAVVGLPFVTDIQTLDIDQAGSTVKESRFLVTKVGCYVQDTLGFFAGSQEPTTATGLTVPGGGSLEPVVVTDRDENTSTTPITGYRSVNIDGRHDDNGRIFIRNVDPSPLTILALTPHGYFPKG